MVTKKCPVFLPDAFLVKITNSAENATNSAKWSKTLSFVYNFHWKIIERDLFKDGNKQKVGDLLGSSNCVDDYFCG